MEPTPDEALLTAYLDGELSPEEQQLLEQRLANEPELRQRLTVLEETWHYLDLLEQEVVDTEKIETTLKIAAVSVSGKPFLPQKTSRFVKWTIATLAGLSLFIITFNYSKQTPLDDPSVRRQIERLDMYLAIANDEEGIELLQQLAFKRIFLPPLNDDEPQIDMSEYLPSSRTSPTVFNDEFGSSENNQLFYKNFQTYNGLPRDKIERIRKLHWDIESASRSAELLLTLQNYYHWHKSLQSYERTALRQPKPPEEKAADISALKMRLDQLENTILMPSEIVGIDESERLAETLGKLPLWRQERVLNNDPQQIITELKQSSHY
jgi:hypothetical protein